MYIEQSYFGYYIICEDWEIEDVDDFFKNEEFRNFGPEN